MINGEGHCQECTWTVLNAQEGKECGVFFLMVRLEVESAFFWIHSCILNRPVYEWSFD